ncbi:PREDICTED: sodium/potassium/calcium exchanger 4-like isoform X2 [Nicrophorus vespilloides]|uniref:Sodium/potassium/calcium exchanger 4-like isoform X2 n=1 Tax=Nicrophorus vespilloides TaxID=110193 RepID=A0ABM1NF19_NICVS|nr:PREDICTED: sodium/potassium/calcium exchanger 4-like isoform X2 [Nicrophorus vespilloides]
MCRRPTSLRRLNLIQIVEKYNSRNLLNLVEGINCTPAAINEFPDDGFTRNQRQSGWAILHACLACYLFILLAIVCDDYFVPAIKKLCDNLKLKEDIAGATFMATASSSPELFINCVGTFITEGDIGVGTIVGSAVFNVLAVPACCGLFANMVLQLEWWPITRDSLMYGVAVLMLIGVLRDGQIECWEAAMLVSAYIFYILMMCFNDKVINTIHRIARCCRKRRNHFKEVMSETRPLLKENGNCCKTNGNSISIEDVFDTELTLKDCEDFEESTKLWEWPSSYTILGQMFWLVSWPISFVLSITTPDCRKYPRLYVLTFIMCIFWIGSTSYMVAWLITVVGDTLNIPDSVMGLTFLAAGTSVPEAVSSVIVTNQGHGSMGLSSSIGSNTFDILLCLGLPWLVKTWFYPKVAGDHVIDINSGGLTYSALSLLSTLVMFYLSLLFNKFKLDWKVGLTCLLMYIGFLSLASLIELNTFFPVNLPTCDR